MPSPNPHHMPLTGQAGFDRSPFLRLTELIAGITPSQPVINLSVGEPQHGVPDLIKDAIASHIAEFGKYPPIKGIEAYRIAAARWMNQRFALPRALDPESEILALNGSREGLFMAAMAARQHFSARTRPLILMPNPFYPAYAAGALAAGCEAVHLPAIAANGFLPDLDAIPADILARTIAFYLASPANPQGAVASRDYYKRLHALALKYDFMIFGDECYSEIYTIEPPCSLLEISAPDFKNTIVFQSLSKRSNLPGLRTGFAAGDKDFLVCFLELRAIAGPQVPNPLQWAAAAAYNDEAHVEQSRARYRTKFDLADRLLKGRFNYKRPQGGFCLWLDVSAHGNDEIATQKLWREAGVRVIPGSYLATTQADGSNPGRNYIRVALVQDEATTEDALNRILATLDQVQAA